MTANSPPYRKVTPEEFERAARNAAAEDERLEEISAAFLDRFAGGGSVREFMLLPQIDVGFRAYIFFETDTEVEACRKSGLAQQMREFLSGCLRPLDGQEPDLLALEIDSHANVVRDFEGSYFLRLRAQQVQERGERSLR